MNHPSHDPDLPERLARVREAVDQAAKKAGRQPSDVALVAVSKRHPAAAVAALARTGHLDFGESYVQEALAKQDELATYRLRWHFIGRLQTNKARFVPGRFHLVHGVDSLKLAQTLHNVIGARSAPRQPVLIQVNVGCEAQKSGVSAEDLEALATAVLDLGNLDLKGLMCMPPFDEDPERTRPYFSRTRELKLGLESLLGRNLPHLSMGMSMDYRQAIEEGATLVRVGTDIFGARPG